MMQSLGTNWMKELIKTMEGDKVNRTDLHHKSLCVHAAYSLNRGTNKNGKFFEETTAKVNPKAKHQLSLERFKRHWRLSLKVSSGDLEG